jgi:hypothetical protein
MKVKFGEFVNYKTPHVICPSVEDVFANNIEENSYWFLPLLSVNIQEINPEWQGILHFVYHNANLGGISFKIKEGKYIYEGKYGFDDGEMNERDRKKGFLNLVELDVPELIEDKYFEWVDEIYALAEKLDKPILYNIKFGYIPWWIQFRDNVPLNPSGEEMTFIGQIRADRFAEDVNDFDLYLFYCPKYQMAVQIEQCT